MFCPKCGKELPENAQFCAGCGANVNEPVKSQVVAPQNISATSSPSPQPVQPQTPQQASKPSVDVKGEIYKLQSKLDNSNSSFLKGRSIWDVVGLCGVILMVICFFLPAITATSYSGTSSLSPASLMSMAGSSSYTSSFSTLLLIYLFPAVCSAIDLLVVNENSTRHIRLIVLGFLNMFLQSSFSSIAKYISSFGGSLGVGFYLNMFASVVVIAIGIVGIYEKKKGKILN